MKKIAVVLASIGLFAVVAQAQRYIEHPLVQRLVEVERKAEQARLEQLRLRAMERNNNSIEQNTTVHFRIQEQLINTNTDISWGTYDADIVCKAYPLDAHWLVVAESCLDVSTQDIFETNDHEYIARKRVKEQLLEVGGKNIGTRAIYRQGNLMLIRLFEENYQAPYVHLLAVSSPAKLFALASTHEVKINTARYAVGGTDHTCSRNLKKKSAQGPFFQLEEGVFELSGTATDPLFMINEQKQHEVLAAYNQGKVTYALQINANDLFHTSSTNPSKDWRILNLEDLQFVKKTISQQEPAAWERVKNRLFFENLNKPFFE